MLADKFMATINAATFRVTYRTSALLTFGSRLTFPSLWKISGTRQSTATGTYGHSISLVISAR